MAVTQQPGGRNMLVGSVQGHRDWDTGLLSCCSDCKACLYGGCLCRHCVMSSETSPASEVRRTHSGYSTEDSQLCVIMAWCCLPCTVCSLSSRMGDCMCMPWFVPGALVAMRTRVRTLGGIQGSICGDCVAMSLCGICGICQMQRELDAMGL